MGLFPAFTLIGQRRLAVFPLGLNDDEIDATATAPQNWGEIFKVGMFLY